MRILVVEDYEPLREALAQGLREAQFAVDLHLFGSELREHLLVAAAVCFRDEGANLTLAALKMTMLERVKSVFYLLRNRLSI